MRLQLLAVLLFAAPVLVNAGLTIDEAARSLPDKINTFRADGPAAMPMHGVFERIPPEDVSAISHAARKYVAENGHTFVVDVVRTRSDSAAYALLSDPRSRLPEIKLGLVGTAGSVSQTSVIFCRGENFVQVWQTGKEMGNQDEVLSLARGIAANLEPGEDDVPVLVKHLPDWQSAQPRATYAVSVEALKAVLANPSILDSINFEGGTEAVAAYYGSSHLVIVEFTTPQLSGDSDRRITPKIQELRAAGQPAPSAYRRVGNYSVFVFNAPDEKTATQLIDQVKYEQVVQWLGDDPYWWGKAPAFHS